MKEIFTSNDQLFDFSDNQHLITFAEEGFSPLSIRLRALRYKKEEIVEITETVNTENSYKTLLPEFPITVVPRRFIRSRFDKSNFEYMLVEILLKCDREDNSKTILFDFRTPGISDEIQQLIRYILLKPHQYLNLKNFSIIGINNSNKSEFMNDVIQYENKIKTIFIRKNFGKIYSENHNTRNLKKNVIRHWYQIKDKRHAVKYLQPKNIQIILGIFSSTDGSSNGKILSTYNFAKFLSILIITNLISQITHNSKIKLKDTFGKIILFPEIVGDCPGACYLHFEYTRFAQLILESVKTEFGEITSDTLRGEINDLLQSHIDAARDHIDELLVKLVDDEVLDLCRETVLLKLSFYDEIRLD